METVNANGSQLTPFILLFALASWVRKGEIAIAAPPNLIQAVHDALPPGFDSITVVENAALQKDELHLIDILGRTRVELVRICA